MPNWAGSSWYFLRYCDPKNNDALAAKEALDYWMPVDWYNGGMEHTTLHLLYSRFWNLFLHDIGVCPVAEPYKKRTSHGMVLAYAYETERDENGQVTPKKDENGNPIMLLDDNGKPIIEKMSKSRGNVVNPDDVVAEIGADAFRMYEMFMGAFEQAIPWSTTGAVGCRKFIERVWRLQGILSDEEGMSKDLKASVHTTIKKVSEDYDAMKFNTAIAQMMTLVNEMVKKGSVTNEEYKALLLLLSPVAPHVCEEIWEAQGYGAPIYTQSWPVWDEEAMKKDEVEIAIQINGKIRGRIMVPADLKKEDADVLRDNEAVKEAVGDKQIMKFIFVPGRLLNIVVK